LFEALAISWLKVAPTNAVSERMMISLGRGVGHHGTCGPPFYLVGLDAAFCVWSTAGSSVEYGYKTVVISDAIVTFNDRDAVLQTYEDRDITLITSKDF
jgi:hypothetical protein